MLLLAWMLSTAPSGVCARREAIVQPWTSHKPFPTDGANIGCYDTQGARTPREEFRERQGEADCRTMVHDSGEQEHRNTASF